MMKKMISYFVPYNRYVYVTQGYNILFESEYCLEQICPFKNGVCVNCYRNFCNIKD